MLHAAITAENLSKVYRLGVKDESPDTIASAFTGALRSPLKNWRRLRDLARFKPDDDSPDALWALRDVSFEVQEGEVLGVIGRNGAGKSTLLKILSRITEPTHGRAVIRGRVSSLLEVGTGFHPELTGRENIYMNGTILGMRKREIDRKFDEIVDFSGVEKFLDTPIKRYSSGMNVRLAFAVAAHLEPEILIIDEVLAVGDAEFQKKCLGKMQDVARGGRTVLFVSHNMAAVSNLCEHALVLSHGRVVFHGLCNEGIGTHVATSSPGTGRVHLSEHENRRKGATPLLRALELRDSAGNVAAQVLCGDRLSIVIEVEPTFVAERHEVSIVVYDQFGSRLFTLGTYLARKAVAPMDQNHHVVCTIDELPLPPGPYSMALFAGPLQQVDLDAIEPALSFDVLDGDYYGNGRNAHRTRGPFLIRSQWTWEFAGDAIACVR